MKLRVFRSLFALLFLGLLAAMYLINPEVISWPLIIVSVIVYSVLELIISLVIGRDRYEDDDYEKRGH